MDRPPGKQFRIAVIRGDGIGREVVPEGIRALEAAGRRFGTSFKWREFDWSCDTYLATGEMMPADGLEQLRNFDAIFLGAVGHPRVPDHVSLWGLLIPIRRAFQQYVNLRPVRLLPGIDTPLKGYPPGRIDFCVVRENNEGEYSEMGGRIYRYLVRAFRQAPRLVRCSRGIKSFRRHPVGPWPRGRGLNRDCAIREPEPRARVSFDVRAGSRLGA